MGIAKQKLSAQVKQAWVSVVTLFISAVPPEDVKRNGERRESSSLDVFQPGLRLVLTCA